MHAGDLRAKLGRDLRLRDLAWFVGYRNLHALAEEIGVSRSTIYRYAQGEMPNTDVLRALAVALSVRKTVVKAAIRAAEGDDE